MRLSICAALIGAIAAGPVYSYSLHPLPVGLSANQACIAAVGSQAANVVDENSLQIAALIYGSLGRNSMAAVGSWYDQTYGGGCIMAIVSSTAASLAVHVYNACPAGSMVVCSTPSKPYGYTTSTSTTTLVRSTTATQTVTASTQYTTLPTSSITVTTTSQVLTTVTTTTSLVSPTMTFPVPTSMVLAEGNQYFIPLDSPDLVPADQAEARCEFYGSRLAYITNAAFLSFPTLPAAGTYWVAPYCPQTGLTNTLIGLSSTGTLATDVTLESYNIITNAISLGYVDYVCMISNGAGGQTYTFNVNGSPLTTLSAANTACGTNGVIGSLPGLASSPFGVPGSGTYLAWGVVNSPTNFACGYWTPSTNPPDSILTLSWSSTPCTTLTSYPVCYNSTP